MSRMLCHIQSPSADFCHRAGQTLLRPLSIVVGNSHSLAKRVMVAAVAIFLFPITLAAGALGALLLTFSATHKKAYQDAKITVTWKAKNTPEIQSRQVTLRPIQPGDLPVYQTLFNNAVAMAKYRGGVRNITDRFNGWLDRWKEHSFSALAVVDRETNRVIGHTIVGHGDYEGDLNKGWSEMAIVIDPAYWNTDFKDGVKGAAGKKHIGTEVVRCMVAYAKALKELKRGVPSDVSHQQRQQIEEANNGLRVHRNAIGKIDWVYLPFTQLRATALREDNFAGHKILTKVFVQENRAITVPKNERDLFVMNL